MEMVVVAAAAASFYMFNLLHVHLCQMAVPTRCEIIFAHCLHHVDDADPWASAGCGTCLDVMEAMESFLSLLCGIRLTRPGLSSHSSHWKSQVRVRGRLAVQRGLVRMRLGYWMYGEISPLEEVGPVETHLGAHAQEIEQSWGISDTIRMSFLETWGKG